MSHLIVKFIQKHQVFLTRKIDTNGAMTRIGGLKTCERKPTGASACIMLILELYPGFSAHITKNAVVPCECPMN